jgi:DNA polymerase III subunit epsilon
MSHRQICLDTETTGLKPEEGHRVLEIGAVELIDRRLTGRRFHRYINPERAIDADAAQVHGLTQEFLADKPVFAEIAKEFIDFVKGAELVIHNAPFDLGFLNAELARMEDQERIGKYELSHFCPNTIDTYKLARELHPGQRNNLDALCKRYGIDNAARVLHGALLDAELLAEVYLAMTRGQDSLEMTQPAYANPVHARPVSLANPGLRVLAATPEELAAHARYLEGLRAGGHCLWLELQEAPGE